MDGRAWIVAACAIVVALGIGLGAQTQKETFLHPEKLQDEGIDDPSSNLVTLTAIIPALGLTAAAWVMSSRPWKLRVIPAFAIFTTTWALVWLIQSSVPNYDAIKEVQQASFTISPLISNGAAVSALVVGPLALALGAGMLLAWGLQQTNPVKRTAPTLTLRFTGALMVAAPFLAVAAAGTLRLLVGLPVAEARAAPYMFALPLIILSTIGLLVVGAIKLWHLAAFERNALLADASREAWHLLSRIEIALLATLAGTAVLATALPAIEHALLASGRTLVLTTRGYTQAQIFLLIPLVPWLAMGRVVERRMATGHMHHRSMHEVPAIVPVTWGVLGVILGSAALLTWLAPGPLWAWVGALAPALLFASITRSQGSGWIGMILAIALWGIGNTIIGQFALQENTAITLTVAPGALAFVRFLAVVTLAFAVTSIAREHARPMRRAVAWPLAIGLGAALALVALIELPFSAWISSSTDGEFVGIGSVIASHDRPVRYTFHALALAFAASAGLLASRIHRPDWFRRPAAPVPVLDASTA